MKFVFVFALCVSAVLAEVAEVAHEEQVHHETELFDLCKEQGVFANPHDPEHRSFIRCELEPIELQCDDGFLFNEEQLKCVEIPKPEPVDLDAVNWREILTCPEDVADKFYRNPYDCSKFYRCYHQGEFKRMDPMTCLPTWIFDEVIETCLPAEQFKGLYGVECVARALPEIRKPEEPIPEEPIPEEPVPEEKTPEEPLPEEHIPEEPIPEEPIPEEPIPEEPLPEEPIPEEKTPEEPIPEEPLPEEPIPEEKTPEEHLPEEHIPEEPIPEEPLPEEPIPEEPVPEEKVPEEHVPEEHVPEEPLPEEQVPEVPEEPVPEEKTQEKPNLNEILKQIKDLFGN